MKLREGFVSSSSSTSFTIVFKGDEPTEEILLDALGLEPDSPLLGLGCKIVEIISRQIATKPRYNSFDQYVKMECEGNADWAEETVREIFDRCGEGWTIVVGTVANDSDDYVEGMLFSHGVEIEQDDLIILTGDQ